MRAKMLSAIFFVFISSATANNDINNDIVKNSTIGNLTQGERGDGRNIPIFNVISFPNRLNVIIIITSIIDINAVI